MSNSSDNLMDVEAGGEQTQYVMSISVAFHGRHCLPKLISIELILSVFRYEGSNTFGKPHAKESGQFNGNSSPKGTFCFPTYCMTGS